MKIVCLILAYQNAPQVQKDVLKVSVEMRMASVFFIIQRVTQRDIIPTEMMSQESAFLSVPCDPGYAMTDRNCERNYHFNFQIGDQTFVRNLEYTKGK
jgi:hypothetical protein